MVYFQNSAEWLLTSNIHVSRYDNRTETDSDARPLVTLFKAQLGQTIWEINDVNAQILHSNLSTTTVKVAWQSLSNLYNSKKNIMPFIHLNESYISFLHGMNVILSAHKSNIVNITWIGTTEQNLDHGTVGYPVTEFVNSSVKHLLGVGINMHISDCFMLVNNRPPLSSMFIVRNSTVNITDCVFYGVRDPSAISMENYLDFSAYFEDFSCIPEYGTYGTNLFLSPEHMSSVLFVYNYSSVIITKSSFQGIHMNLSYDVTSCIYAIGSQIELYKTITGGQ